jgi:hypothetical protein
MVFVPRNQILQVLHYKLIFIIMTEAKWECKVCMDEAKDAVVTRCGHLYCWQCVYQWQQTKATDIFPCPVCHAEVALGDLIPLFASQ